MKNAVTLLSVCGLCATIATAQVGRVVNISGATLLENYVKAPASTNDYIDVDGNGVAGSLGSFSVQQLAQGGPSGDPAQHFVVQYRVVGSVNGFIELTRFGRPNFVTTDSFDVNGILGAAPAVGQPNPGVASFAYVNRVLFINNGVRAGSYNAGNPGGFPVRSTSTTNAFGIYAFPDTPAAGGSAIDIAPLDVSTVWAVRKGAVADAQWSDTPLQDGYGRNPRVSTNKTGGLSGAGLSAELASLNGRNLYTGVPASADSNTIFDQELAFAAIAPVVSPGTGIRRVKMTELQHMFGTGRAVTGENFMVVTRDVGSGTRNAFENCIGQDPSWGVGDNIGALSTTTAQNNLGAAFLPTNKGSNGGMESTLRNARLGIGYVGTERGVTGSGSGSWLTSAALEIADVANDIYAGWTPGTYSRPTTTNIVNNSANGWVLGGQAVLATIGDPLAEPVSLGGTGAATPQMSNPAAAAYMNNIRQSIANFVTLPTDPENFGMPGEFAATQFLLLNALDRLHSLSVPTTMISNVNFNLNLKNYTLSNNVHNNPAFASYNTATAGRAPTRTTLAGLATYSDGVALGSNYINQGLANVSYGSTLAQRNKIAGDFSGNGVRDVNDATEMVNAWRQRNGGPVWAAPAGTGSIAGAPGTDAVIEILGDFDGDGSFTTADVRYFADGLAMDAGQLDRAGGFEAVDVAFGGNFFGTLLPATVGGPRLYKNGDSRADVAGATGVTRGFAPTGFNGTVNAADIDYVFDQFMSNPAVVDGAMNWANLDEAVYGDLSCDMNSDLIVDRADITNILQNVLCTRWWDVNLDGLVDATDRGIATANLGNAGGWAMGDVDGDGIITAADVTLICGADFNGDSSLDFFDYLDFVDAFSSGACHADVNGDSVIDFFDYLDFVDAFSSGC